MNKNRLCFFLCLFATALVASAADIGVRIRFGLKDEEPTQWDGAVSVSQGSVALIGGWRFVDGDTVDGTTGWKARTRRIAQLGRGNNPQKNNAQAKKQAGGPMSDNGVLITFADVAEDSRVTIKTAKGDFDFSFSEIPYGKFIEKLDGAIEIERTAAAAQLTTERTDDDYPAAAVAPDGTVFVSYVSFTPGLDRDERAKRLTQEPKDFSFLAKTPGGDQIWLRVQRNGKWSEPHAVTAGHGDIYKCALAVDGDGRAWIFWSENKNWPGKGVANFEIFARSFENGKFSEPVNLSNNAASDVNPAVATDSNGRVWLAWQAVRDGVFKIVERHQTAKGWSDERVVSTQSRTCWMPAVAASKEDKIAIAWDTYDKGDYDIWLREFSTDGKAEAARPVANSPDYEARPAMTFDKSGALWIAWEQSGPTWGKDFGALVQDKGIPLYRDRQIGLAILKDGKWMQPAESFAGALPGGGRARKRINNVRVPPIEPGGESRKAGQEIEALKNVTYNNLARIVTDSTGNVWVFSRTRQNDFARVALGSLWLNWAAYFDGEKWTGPILVPHSDNLLYNQPAVVALPKGGLLVAHSSDHRQDRHLQRVGGGGNDTLDAEHDPFDNDIYISTLEAPAGGMLMSHLKPATHLPDENAQPSDATKKELADIARVHSYKITFDGKNLRPIRGEFHRHTEISGDGGFDGPLEDMWRYAMDVAAMDWLACSDHDNGGGREYTWWLTQKTTDAFRIAGKFEPPFAYERSVVYPEGHRNVIFVQRGVRTLPRLPKTDEEPVVHAPDTQMLYKYLHFFNGVCASHTSATNMGTDWRDNDPQVEPMVEIYQGCRQNYERPGAPRSPTEADAIGGWRPKGFINLALQRGYRFSFESSSDHRSTHISYAVVYAENNSREALVAAMRKRHTYAATDNILADFRCGEHMMGDEFSTGEPPKLSVKLLGGAPFAKVTLVKDDVEIPLGPPNSAEFEATWIDPSPTVGKTSYYYVRGEQTDGELVWASPMWITYQPKK